MNPIVLLLAGLLTAALSQSIDSQYCSHSLDRRDCGYLGIDQDQCEDKGCCWSPTREEGLPWCYFPSKMSAYAVQKESKTNNGWHLDLELVHGTAAFGNDIQNLSVDVFFETADRIRVKITDANNKRFEIPQSVLSVPDAPAYSPNLLNYKFSYTLDPFGFAVKRNSDGAVLFNTTTARGLIFEDQYIQISTQLPSDPNVYGFAERIDPLKLPLNTMYTMWSYDIPTPDHQNLYGVHPFYMELRNGKAHSVFLKNSNAQEVYLQAGLLTYHVTGGILDFYIMVGDTPDLATKQYHEVIGKPHMPPFWSLGWHQCRYGFKDLDEIETVVSSYKANNIPLDTIWADIDHMDQYKDFTWDPVNFPQDKVRSFVDQLHSQNQKMVVIVDPGIHNVDGYYPYEEGLKRDIFIKNADGSNFIGKVWPGTTVFPDFLNPDTQDYWYTMIKNFLDGVPLDGLWIDMNEISNFCNGDCDQDQQQVPRLQKPVNSKFDPLNPPYSINNADHQGSLNEKTLDMDTVHYGDQAIEYNVHSLYGLSESIATKVALEKYYGKRSFVLSRSTFPGSGGHVAHWLGDNHANFKSMSDSFPGAMMFNILGVPLVGSDICGFMENATEELCARWHAVGAFYPFARNHQAIGTNFKYPYMWPTVQSAAIRSLNARYSLLSYYYTLFYRANQNGGTVMRPLFYEFPADSNVSGIDQQFMIGSALLFSPCLSQGATSVDAYFPEARWYDFWTGSEFKNFGGSFQTLDVPLDYIPIHIRGGSVVPTQTPSLTSGETKLNPFTLTVALDSNGHANGELYYDDGEDLNVGKSAMLVTYSVSNGKLSASIVQNNYSPANTLELAKIVVLGLDSFSGSPLLNGQSAQFSWDSSLKSLTIYAKINLLQLESVSWSSALK